MVILNVDGIHGAIQELMKRQKYLILKNEHEIAKQYMELKIINQNYKSLTNEMDLFLFITSSFLCLLGYEFI